MQAARRLAYNENSRIGERRPRQALRQSRLPKNPSKETHDPHCNRPRLDICCQQQEKKNDFKGRAWAPAADEVMPTPLLPDGQNRSIALAADVRSLEDLRALLLAAKTSSAVGAVKIGFSLALRHGLAAVVAEVRGITGLPIVYDHQKAGTDIPEMGQLFANVCSEAGVDALIIFPHSGPRTLEAFVAAAFQNTIVPIVGLTMTHRGYIQSDGGYIVDQAPFQICETALRLGVTNFVLPATNPSIVQQFSAGPLRNVAATIWLPGIGRQGGSLTAALKSASPHKAVGIIGSAVYDALDPAAAIATFAAEIIP